MTGGKQSELGLLMGFGQLPCLYDAALEYRHKTVAVFQDSNVGDNIPIDHEDIRQFAHF